MYGSESIASYLSLDSEPPLYVMIIVVNFIILTDTRHGLQKLLRWNIARLLKHAASVVS